MTLQQFVAVTKGRIPTPEEFLGFVEAQGWKIDARTDGTASLKADRTDELAVALARMLSREPYRTNVLNLLRARWQSVTPTQEVAVPAAEVPPPESAREWRWREGQTYVETPDNEWLYGHADRHPTGAMHWRYQGESEWQEVRR